MAHIVHHIPYNSLASIEYAAGSCRYSIYFVARNLYDDISDPYVIEYLAGYKCAHTVQQPCKPVRFLNAVQLQSHAYIGYHTDYAML